MRWMPLAPAILASATLVSPAPAHHSFAMYDLQRVVALDGVVREFRWVNPHSSMVVAVDARRRPRGLGHRDDQSRQPHAAGWTRKSLKAGDRVQVEFVPLRSGKHGGGFRKATLLDTGQVVSGSLVDAEKRK